MNLKKYIPFSLKFAGFKFLYNCFLANNKLHRRKVNVLSSSESIRKIVNERLSVSRFGDGEFKWIFQQRESGNFEMNSPKLASRLLEVLQIPKDDHVVCVPDVFTNLNKFTPEAAEYWAGALGRYGNRWIKLLSSEVEYCDTQFTRPYMDYVDKNADVIQQKFDGLKTIWEGKDLLIVEGSKTRFGIGNDLLASAKSIRRILCPSVNAFESYDQILKTVSDYILENKTENLLVLLSLGPAATVMAYDLVDTGAQVIDIGHVDLEYSWFKMGATTKVPVDFKYVNENKDGHDVTNITDEEEFQSYKQQVVCTIETR